MERAQARLLPAHGKLYVPDTFGRIFRTSMKTQCPGEKNDRGMGGHVGYFFLSVVTVADVTRMHAPNCNCYSVKFINKD